MTDDNVRDQLLQLGVDPEQVLRDALEAKLRKSRSSTPTSLQELSGPDSVETTSLDDREYRRSLPLDVQRRKYIEGMIKPTSLGKRPQGNTSGRSLSQPQKRTKKNSQNHWKVGKLLDVRVKHLGEGLERRQFLVRWKGCGSLDDEWVDEHGLSDSYEQYHCEKCVRYECGCVRMTEVLRITSKDSHPNPYRFSESNAKVLKTR